jgi:hypothetical protein
MRIAYQSGCLKKKKGFAFSELAIDCWSALAGNAIP